MSTHTHGRKRREVIPERSARYPGPDRSDECEQGERSSLQFRSFIPRDEVVAYFEAIVTGLKNGQVHFKQGESSLLLEPPGHIDMHVKASRNGPKHKILFEIIWRDESNDALTISSS
jgi:amphi-Trp domain-containing protein